MLILSIPSSAFHVSPGQQAVDKKSADPVDLRYVSNKTEA